MWQFHAAEIPDLKGPQNDLAAMESLVRAKGATDVTVLRNEAVTRTGIETALHALGLRARPGDTIMIYYSGHGAEAQAAVKGTADGDLDQFLPLAGFDLDHQDPERFIVDKDLYSWVARYVPRSVTVFMMADACHSGTLHRSVDPAMFHFTPRLAFRGGTRGISLVGRPAPRFASVLSGGDDGAEPAARRADLPNEIYIGAARDDQLALEAALPAEGAPSRGLLTYAFEQALTVPGADGRTLAADLDHDGRVTIGELSTYLNAQVRMLTGQRQESSAHYPDTLNEVALFEEVANRPAAVAAPARSQAAVFVAGSGGTLLDGIPGLRRVAAAPAADFTWDPAAGIVTRRSGDRVATEVTSPNALAGVIGKWNAVETLRPLAGSGGAALSIGPGRADARHPGGQTVEVTLHLPDGAGTAGGPRYATVFDIAGDGTVQALYPDADDGAGTLAPGQSLPVLSAKVVPPYGTDHVVAVVTAQPQDELRQRVRAANDQRAAGRLVEPIRSALAAAGPGGALAIAELYTGR